jgi:5-methylcytosine-specific restriction enzyme A
MKTFHIELKVGDKITNKKLSKIFSVDNNRGMRRSKKNNCLVLIANHTNNKYHDRWGKEGTEFYYTGMGKDGDQRLDYDQNKVLYNSAKSKTKLYLFEVFKKNEYTYQGRVILEREPHVEKQEDEHQHLRKVYIFPLKLKDSGSQVPTELSDMDNLQESQKRKCKKYSIAELRNITKNSKNKLPSERRVISTHYERNQYIVECTKKLAEGVCDLCNEQAPFKNRKREPYLEVHHINWLSKGGEDSMCNVAALCPNCHKKMHILKNNAEIEKLKVIANKRAI